MSFQILGITSSLPKGRVRSKRFRSEAKQAFYKQQVRHQYITSHAIRDNLGGRILSTERRVTVVLLLELPIVPRLHQVHIM